MYDKPLPIIDPDSAPYWKAAKNHKLLLKRCSACGKAHFYPRELCPHCHADTVDWIEARGTGSI